MSWQYRRYGTLSTAQTATHPGGNFRFELAGVRFSGRLDAAEGPRTMLRLSADLGGLPYSAEDKGARKRWRAALESADASAADHHALAADQHIHFESATMLAAPPTGPQLIEMLTVVLLTLRNRLGAPDPAPVRRFRAEGRG